MEQEFHLAPLTPKRRKAMKPSWGGEYALSIDPIEEVAEPTDPLIVEPVHKMDKLARMMAKDLAMKAGRKQSTIPIGQLSPIRPTGNHVIGKIVNICMSRKFTDKKGTNGDT
jgi:hypothetical protein